MIDCLIDFGSGTDPISLLTLLLLFSFLGRLSSKKSEIRSVKSDRDEIWKGCSSKCMSTDSVGLLV